jgi:hypothetical protein
MKINEVKIGNGISRFEVEPQVPSEKNVPQHIIDLMIEDIIKQKNGSAAHSYDLDSTTNATKAPIYSYDYDDEPDYGDEEEDDEWGWEAEKAPNREPDGIDIHVDRPLREKFATYGSWVDAIAKYRSLERLAHECDWPCKEPMKGVTEEPRFSAPPKKAVSATKKVDKLTVDDIVDIANLILEKLL